MSRRRWIRIAIAGFCGVIILALIVVLLFFDIFPETKIPSGALMPEGIAFSASAHDLPVLIDNHFSGGRDRARTTEAVLRRFGFWDSWSAEGDEPLEKFAEYESYFNRVATGEFHAIVGQFVPERFDLVLMVEADSLAKRNIDPLIQIAGDDLAITSTQHRKKKVSMLQGEEGQPEVGWTLAGGWILVHVLPDDTRLLENLIDLALDSEIEADAGEVDTAEPGLGAIMDVALLKRFSDSGESRITATAPDDFRAFHDWLQGLGEIDLIGLQHNGERLFDFDVTLKGPAILEASFLAETGDLSVERKMGEGRGELPPAIMQFEFAHPLVVEGSEMFGLNWPEVIESVSDYDWVRPGLVEAVGPLLTAEVPDPDQRIGWALLPNHAEPVPAGIAWQDNAPYYYGDVPPADAWGSRAAETVGGDQLKFFGKSVYGPIKTLTPARIKKAWLQGVWASRGAPPLAYGAIHFDEFADSVYAFPAIVLDEELREGWRELGAWAEFMNIVTGSLSARVDRRGEDELTLEVRGL